MGGNNIYNVRLKILSRRVMEKWLGIIRMGNRNI